MRNTKAILNAYETLQKGRSSAGKDGDARVGSTHNRRNRGFVRVQYADREVIFYPVKFWPSVVGVTTVTLRNWLNKGIISAYTMHEMHVMSKAELHALHRVVQVWYATRDMHNAIEPEFRTALKESLASVRLALDTYKRHLPMSPAMLDLLQPSFKDSTNV